DEENRRFDILEHGGSYAAPPHHDVLHRDAPHAHPHVDIEHGGHAQAGRHLRIPEHRGGHTTPPPPHAPPPRPPPAHRHGAPDDHGYGDPEDAESAQAGRVEALADHERAEDDAAAAEEAAAHQHAGHAGHHGHQHNGDGLTDEDHRNLQWAFDDYDRQV